MSDYRVQYHEEDGNSIVSYWQDAEPLMDYAAACRREDREHTAFGKRGEFRRVMTVPMTTVLAISTELGLDPFNPEHSKKIYEVLKGRDYAKFRTVDKLIL